MESVKNKVDLKYPSKKQETHPNQVIQKGVIYRGAGRMEKYSVHPRVKGQVPGPEESRADGQYPRIRARFQAGTPVIL